MGSERERERARESFNRKNEKEKWVGFRERERALSDKNEKENGFRERERASSGKWDNVGVGCWGNNKKMENIDYFTKRDVKIDELMWLFCKSKGWEYRLL